MNIIGVIMFFAGCWIVAMNWLVVWKIWVVKDEKAPSWAPILGGALVSFGLWIQPYETLSSWWWIGFLVDYGCFFGFAHTALFWIWMLYLWSRSGDDTKGPNR
ncbi:MAG: hypothetical protein QM501_02605 [Gimesia sp.]